MEMTPNGAVTVRDFGEVPFSCLKRQNKPPPKSTTLSRVEGYRGACGGSFEGIANCIFLVTTYKLCVSMNHCHSWCAIPMPYMLLFTNQLWYLSTGISRKRCWCAWDSLNTPTTWCLRMVVTSKVDDNPMRTVDIQPQNRFCLCQTYL
ncbi:hypothetical protein DPMN_006805 [Dreissena polymorpha]|uniref:Uncharacterized protein n=1 Tax=Dreissena polymorpha TaxID=45954 RepID=A0A9D4MW28_DREPO|nr:hypothetical protein DPMN_006805 [Dreissena polymorpha]